MPGGHADDSAGLHCRFHFTKVRLEHENQDSLEDFLQDVTFTPQVSGYHFIFAKPTAAGMFVSRTNASCGANLSFFNLYSRNTGPLSPSSPRHSSTAGSDCSFAKPTAARRTARRQPTMGKAKAKRGKNRREHKPVGAVGGKGSAPAAAAAGGTSELPPLLQKLESADDNERLNGCQAIAHLATESRQNITELMQYSVFEMLGARLVDSVKDVQVAAAGAVTNMLTEGGVEAAHAMLVSGALGTILSQLQSARTKPVEQSVGAANPAQKLIGERVKRQEEYVIQLVICLVRIPPPHPPYVLASIAHGGHMPQLPRMPPLPRIPQISKAVSTVQHALCQSGPHATEAMSQPAVVDTVAAFLFPRAEAPVEVSAFIAAGPRLLAEVANVLHALTEENPAVALQLGKQPLYLPIGLVESTNTENCVAHLQL